MSAPTHAHERRARQLLTLANLVGCTAPVSLGVDLEPDVTRAGLTRRGPVRGRREGNGIARNRRHSREACSIWGCSPARCIGWRIGRLRDRPPGCVAGGSLGRAPHRCASVGASDALRIHLVRARRGMRHHGGRDPPAGRFGDQRRRHPPLSSGSWRLRAVDLFCGAVGPTEGFVPPASTSRSRFAALARARAENGSTKGARHRGRSAIPRRGLSSGEDRSREATCLRCVTYALMWNDREPSLIKANELKSQGHEL